MPVAPIDIALLLVALVASAYCFLLNRRLRALHDTREGMGNTILALSETISKMNSVTEASGRQARSMAEALDLQMRKTKALSEKMEQLVSRGEETSKVLASQIGNLNAIDTNNSFLFEEQLRAKRDHVTPRAGSRYSYDEED